MAISQPDVQGSEDVTELSHLRLQLPNRRLRPTLTSDFRTGAAGGVWEERVDIVQCRAASLRVSSPRLGRFADRSAAAGGNPRLASAPARSGPEASESDTGSGRLCALAPSSGKVGVAEVRRAEKEYQCTLPTRCPGPLLPSPRAESSPCLLSWVFVSASSFERVCLR